MANTLAKLWMNDAGKIFRLDPKHQYQRVPILTSVDDPDSCCPVRLEDLEDLRGWRPAPDHGPWTPIPRELLGENNRCNFACIGCTHRCTRGTGSPEHTRHYHPVESRDCANAAREKDGYAIERAAAGDWSSWLPPEDREFRLSRPDTLVRAGQAWACRSRNSTAACVVEIRDVGLPVMLARREVPGADMGFFQSAPYDCHAVLIRRTLEEQPRLPSELFTEPETPATSGADPLTAIASRYAASIRMPTIDGQLSEQEIFNLQRLDDAQRPALVLFPDRAARPVVAGARMTADHFGAFVIRSGAPPAARYAYPEVFEDDLLPDA